MMADLTRAGDNQAERQLAAATEHANAELSHHVGNESLSHSVAVEKSNERCTAASVSDLGVPAGVVTHGADFWTVSSVESSVRLRKLAPAIVEQNRVELSSSQRCSRKRYSDSS